MAGFDSISFGNDGKLDFSKVRAGLTRKDLGLEGSQYDNIWNAINTNVEGASKDVLDKEEVFSFLKQVFVKSGGDGKLSGREAGKFEFAGKALGKENSGVLFDILTNLQKLTEGIKNTGYNRAYVTYEDGTVEQYNPDGTIKSRTTTETEDDGTVVKTTVENGQTVITREKDGKVIHEKKIYDSDNKRTVTEFNPETGVETRETFYINDDKKVNKKIKATYQHDAEYTKSTLVEMQSEEIGQKRMNYDGATNKCTFSGDVTEELEDAPPIPELKSSKLTPKQVQTPVENGKKNKEAKKEKPPMGLNDNVNSNKGAQKPKVSKEPKAQKPETPKPEKAPRPAKQPKSEKAPKPEGKSGASKTKYHDKPFAPIDPKTTPVLLKDSNPPKAKGCPISEVQNVRDGNGNYRLRVYGSFYCEIEYNQNGKETKCAYRKTDGDLKFYTIYQYNSKGQLVRDLTMKPDGALQYGYQYEYDSEGKETKHEINSDGTIEGQTVEIPGSEETPKTKGAKKSTPKKVKYKTNPDGSIKITPELREKIKSVKSGASNMTYNITQDGNTTSVSMNGSLSLMNSGFDYNISLEDKAKILNNAGIKTDKSSYSIISMKYSTYITNLAQRQYVYLDLLNKEDRSPAEDKFIQEHEQNMAKFLQMVEKAGM